VEAGASRHHRPLSGDHLMMVVGSNSNGREMVDGPCGPTLLNQLNPAEGGDVEGIDAAPWSFVADAHQRHEAERLRGEWRRAWKAVDRRKRTSWMTS